MKRRADIFISIALTAIFGIIAAAMAIQARDFMRLSGYFPLTIGAISGILAAVIVMRSLLSTARDGGAAELANTIAESTPSGINSARYFGWVLGYLGLIAVLGFPTGTGVFVFAFSMIEARLSWLASFAYASACALIIVTFGHYLNMQWPSSIIPGL